jgi:hypothetical protein
MTILGAVADRDTAVIWADTALTNPRTGNGSGDCCKLAVNGLAGAIGAGRGWGRLATEADAALLAAVGLDEAVPLVCAALRRGAGRLAPRQERVARFSFMGCGYIVAGWSHEAGRMVIYDLDARSNFEPAIASACLVPMVELTGCSVPSLREVASIASRQAAELLARCGYGVGRLTIATITRQGITVLPPQDIVPLPAMAEGDGATPASWEGSSEAGEATPSLHLVA